MGLQPSKQPSIGFVRLQAIKVEKERAFELQRALIEALAAEPADRRRGPGSVSAQLTAVVKYIEQLNVEARAVLEHIGALCQLCCSVIGPAVPAANGPGWLMG